MANWAVIIGVDQYWTPNACLRGAVNDALALGRWLVRTKQVRAANAFYLLGPTAGRNLEDGVQYHRPNQDNIVKVINHLGNASNWTGERLYFHYSGHGIQQPRTEEHALVPEDFTELLTTRSFSLTSILSYFRATQFRDQFFFIDACRNIPWEGDIRIGEWPLPLSPLPRAKDPTLPAPQQFFYFATSPGVK